MNTTKERIRGTKPPKYSRTFGNYFGALISGSNKTAEGFEKKWQAIGTGFATRKTNGDLMLFVTDCDSFGMNKYLNLATFTGSVTRYIDGNAFREVYLCGKIIHQQTIPMPVVKSAKDIINEYNGTTEQPLPETKDSDVWECPKVACV